MVFIWKYAPSQDFQILTLFLEFTDSFAFLKATRSRLNKHCSAKYIQQFFDLVLSTAVLTYSLRAKILSNLKLFMFTVSIAHLVPLRKFMFRLLTYKYDDSWQCRSYFLGKYLERGLIETKLQVRSKEMPLKFRSTVQFVWQQLQRRFEPSVTAIVSLPWTQCTSSKIIFIRGKLEVPSKPVNHSKILQRFCWQRQFPKCVIASLYFHVTLIYIDKYQVTVS